MRIGRLVLVVATLVAILVFPLVLKDAVQALKLPSAYAAQSMADAGGRLYQNGNNNDNDDGDNDDGDNDDGNNDGDDDNDNNNDGSGDGDDNESNDNEGESEDNDNAVCYESLNSNEEVPCDFDDNGNDNYYAPAPAPAPAAPSASAPAPQANNRCFAAGETGNVTLNLSGGAVAVRVVGPGLPQSSWIELTNVNDLGSIPAPPSGATLLDTMVWNINSGAGCSSGAAGQISGDVNLGITYSVSANKSKLQIVMLQNGQWMEVPTVPDPDANNPYISATIRNTGTYAVIQKP
ncbi:MAG: hypothetical protein IT306_00055 [Chloroflexi bacterium]|nr:hypothetical protein [Chloroflexota bacterium]